MSNLGVYFNSIGYSLYKDALHLSLQERAMKEYVVYQLVRFKTLKSWMIPIQGYVLQKMRLLGCKGQQQITALQEQWQIYCS